jgi:Glycosyl hydrolase family 47
MVSQHLNHVDVHMETNMLWGYGVSRQPFVSALQAFWPGLEALSGNPVNGTRQIRPLLQLWRRYQAMPEMFDIISMAPVHYAKDAPLRPELLESLYHVYCVTRHPSLLQAGAEILRALNKYSKVKCGYASIADVITKR